MLIKKEYFKEYVKKTCSWIERKENKIKKIDNANLDDWWNEDIYFVSTWKE
jgi:hypothetical protein